MTTTVTIVTACYMSLIKDLSYDGRLYDCDCDCDHCDCVLRYKEKVLQQRSAAWLFVYLQPLWRAAVNIFVATGQRNHR